MQYFYRMSLAAAAIVAASGSASLGAANPLLGSWKVENLGAQRNSDGFDYCSANPAFTFTSKTEIMFGPASPGQAAPARQERSDLSGVGQHDLRVFLSGLHERSQIHDAEPQ